MATEAEILLSLRDWTLERQESGSVRTLLSGIDLELTAGRWLAITGGNGSGKSSLLHLLAAPESPLRHRTALLCQDPDEQLLGATVDRELTLGRPTLDPAPWKQEFGLVRLGGLDARLLAAGQKQRLALATVLAAEPRVLLCDEPTALQDRSQAIWVLDRLDRWRRETGGALVTATCDLREAERADWLVVLGEGRILHQGPPQGLLAKPEVRDLLLTEDLCEVPRSRSDVPVDAAPVLVLEHVTCRLQGAGSEGGFDGVNLQLRPGDRVGLTGPNGCGKSTLLAACAGVRRPDSGRVLLAGKPLYRRPGQDLDHGAALLAPQFPEYLFTRASVAREIALDPGLADLSPPQLMTDLALAVEALDVNPHDLSGGQRRRLALGMVLLSGRPVLLLDEPTAALDGPGRRLVLQMLARLPAAAALLVASHDHAFLAAAGCRILELGRAGLTATGATASAEPGFRA